MPSPSSRSPSSSSSRPSARGVSLPSPQVSSSSSVAPTTPVRRTALGTALGAAVSSLTLSASLASGGFLVVVAAVLGSPEGVTLTYRGRVLVPDASAALPGAVPGGVFVFSDPFSGGRSGDLVLHAAGGVPAALSLQAVQVTGLTTGIMDQSGTSSGQGTLPDTGATGALAAFASYGQAAFVLAQPGTWSWGGGFVSGGQDLAPAVGAVTEGYRVPVASLAPLRASLTSSPAGWAGLLVVYR